MKTTSDSITIHLAKLKLFREGSERRVWLVYRENLDAIDDHNMLRMCKEWASLDRNAAFEYAEREKKKCSGFKYHVYRAVLYMQDEEIAIKDFIYEKAFTDINKQEVNPPESHILTDEEKPWVSHILWHLDLIPEHFAEIHDLPDRFIVALATQIPDDAFMTLMSLATPALRDRVCCALPQEAAEHIRKYLPGDKDTPPAALQAAETAFREACLALSVSYETNEYSPLSYDLFQRALTAQISINTVNVRRGDSSIYIIGYPVFRSLEAMSRLSIFGKLIYIAYTIRSKGHWGLTPFLRDETNPFFVAGLEFLKYLSEGKSFGFGKRIGKMKKDMLADLDRKMRKAGEMILLMKSASSLLSFADIEALLCSFDDDMIDPFPEESETNANIVRNSLEEYTYRELVCKLIYMGNKACSQGLVSIEMEAEEEPCRILFYLLVSHLAISNEKEEAYYQQLTRKGHLAETAKKIEMIREGFEMIARGYSPHMMFLALQVYLDGGHK